MFASSKGFTLIELMIVVAIVGILSAIAVPMYQAYIIKTQINRTVSEIGAYKSGYESYRVSAVGINNQSLGYTPSSLTTGDFSTEIATVNADGSGHLEVTVGGSAHPNLTDVVVRFERSSAGVWTCVIDRSSAPNWKDSYRPGSCSVL